MTRTLTTEPSPRPLVWYFLSHCDYLQEVQDLWIWPRSVYAIRKVSSLIPRIPLRSSVWNEATLSAWCSLFHIPQVTFNLNCDLISFILNHEAKDYVPSTHLLGHPLYPMWLYVTELENWSTTQPRKETVDSSTFCTWLWAPESWHLQHDLGHAWGTWKRHIFQEGYGRWQRIGNEKLHTPPSLIRNWF